MSKTISVLDKYPDYELTIGMEIHVQLTTDSKIFCSSANEISKDPNTNICNVCTGYPGTLPVLNKQVVDYAILAGLALNCTINKISYFDRKHYFYPDLPKNYQITQNDVPICVNGHVAIRLEDGSIKNIRVKRIHMEEDAGKNIHDPATGESFVDFNRAGTPLLEIVSEPDINSTYEVRAYLKALHSTVQYLGICTGNMEQGAFRGDTNISVRKKGETKLGVRCELKNINSFKFISDAVEYEIERQISTIENGGKLYQETRLWDSKNKKTIVMRTKEGEADYRIFQDPDLPLIELDDAQIARIAATMPELPHQKFDRLIKEKNITPYEAEILVEDLPLANYFEETYAAYPSKNIINWVLRDVMGYLKEQKIDLAAFNVTPHKLAVIIQMLDADKINNHAAKQVFEIVAQSGREPSDIVQELGLDQVGSQEEIEAIIKEIIAANPTQVEQYKAGQVKLFGYFVGQAMAKTQGKGNPKVIQELLKKYLS
jgi:aspartyl-tRNA(Asn)/glutamyl-tRNA(Gln) amidotransferase subunit B